MINFFIKNNYFTKSKVSKADFKSNFFNDDNHKWIYDDKILKRNIEILIDSFSSDHVAFFRSHPTFIIPCQAHLSCAIGRTQNHQLILVFPELIKLLRSAMGFHGLAILAHEFGHIYHQHTEFKIDTLTAQIEADQFALDLGFGEELQEVLLDHAYSADCRVRIARLTSSLISKSA